MFTQCSAPIIRKTKATGTCSALPQSRLPKVSIASWHRLSSFPAKCDPLLQRRARQLMQVDGWTARLLLWRLPWSVSCIRSQDSARYSGYAHARAAGKLLLALVEPSVCNSYLAKHLRAQTSYTITDPEKLEEEFELIRARGYSVDNEEFYEGLQCSAVPVEDLVCSGHLGAQRSLQEEIRRVSAHCVMQPGLIADPFISFSRQGSLFLQARPPCSLRSTATQIQK